MTDEEERNAFEEKLIAFKFCKGLLKLVICYRAILIVFK